MPTEHDMTPVELPYTFTPTEQIPYGHYNTRTVNPIEHNEGLVYNKVHNTWSTALRDSSSEVPDTYELQQNTEISKQIKPYILPGEANSLHDLPLYHSGPSLEELIYKINHPNEQYPSNNDDTQPSTPDEPTPDNPADPGYEPPYDPTDDPYMDPQDDPYTDPTYDPGYDPYIDPNYSDLGYDPAMDPTYEP